MDWSSNMHISSLRLARVVPCIVLVFTMTLPVFAQGGAEAKAFIDSLSEAQQSSVLRPINDPERFNWTFLPGLRDGIRLGDLDETQRAAFRAFLKNALSPQGFRRIDLLRKVEAVSDRGGGVRTGYDEFWIRFYGEPTSRAWAWRIEGHHLVLNAVIVDGEVVSITPLFFGAAPVKGSETAAKEARGVEPLRAEDEAAVALLASLGEKELAVASLAGSLPNEIVSGTNRSVQIPAKAGLSLANMNDAQQALLQSIIDGYLGTWPTAARARLASRFKACDPAEVRFAIAGPTDRAKPHYWRITSPVLVLEYANGRPGAAHVHAVLRTLHGEFPEP